MSTLRSQYSYSYACESGLGYRVKAMHRPFKEHEPSEVAEAIAPYYDQIDTVGEGLIREHMEKVTQMLAGPPSFSEEQDRLAHKADHDNQVEKDLS